MGAMLSAQYGVTAQQGRQSATAAIEHALGSLPKKAVGGPVQANRPVIVGEHRPEVFVPRTPGLIEPSVKDFYRKQGYEEFGRLPYPPKGERIFLRKALA